MYRLAGKQNESRPDYFRVVDDHLAALGILVFATSVSQIRRESGADTLSVTDKDSLRLQNTPMIRGATSPRPLRPCDTFYKSPSPVV